MHFDERSHFPIRRREKKRWRMEKENQGRKDGKSKGSRGYDSEDGRRRFRFAEFIPRGGGSIKDNECAKCKRSPRIISSLCLIGLEKDNRNGIAQECIQLLLFVCVCGFVAFYISLRSFDKRHDTPKRVSGWLDEAAKRITAASGAREIFWPIFEVIAVSRGHSYYNTRMRVFRLRGSRARIPILNLPDRTIAALARFYAIAADSASASATPSSCNSVFIR